MTLKKFLLFMGFAFVVLLFTYIQKEKAKDAYFAKKEELLIFSKEAKELAGLKSKHRDKKVTKRLVSALLKIKKPTKDYTKSKSRVLEFDSVDKLVLNRLIKKIQNSTLDIISFEISRESDSLAKLRVEIKK